MERVRCVRVQFKVSDDPLAVLAFASSLESEGFIAQTGRLVCAEESAVTLTAIAASPTAIEDALTALGEHEPIAACVTSVCYCDCPAARDDRYSDQMAPMPLTIFSDGMLRISPLLDDTGGLVARYALGLSSEVNPLLWMWERVIALMVAASLSGGLDEGVEPDLSNPDARIHRSGRRIAERMAAELGAPVRYSDGNIAD